MFNPTSKLSAVLLLALLPGCFGVPAFVPADNESDGEDTEADTEPASESGEESEAGNEEAGSESGSATADGSSSSGMGEEGMELLSNGSFEMWSGSSPTNWINGDAVLEQLDGDGTDGARSVRVVSTTYQSIGQFVAAPMLAGSCFDLELSLRYDSGETPAPVILLAGRNEAGDEFQYFENVEWSTDQQWNDTQVSFMSAEDWTGFTLSLNSTATGDQAFALDDVSLMLVACD